MDHPDPAPGAAGAYGPNSRQVRAFLHRLEALGFDELGLAIRVWREELSDGWHEADRAVAAAIRDAERHREQETLLEALYDVFRRAPWFTSMLPGTREAASDATAQYIATSALLALLVRDRLAPGYLETLYRPFATLIPLSDLGRPSDGRGRASASEDRLPAS